MKRKDKRALESTTYRHLRKAGTEYNLVEPTLAEKLYWSKLFYGPSKDRTVR